MSLSRRDFMKIGSTTAAAAVVPAPPEALIPRPNVRWVAKTAADMPAPDIAALLLSRAAFGARPGEVERARQMGPQAWIEEQLDAASIDDGEASGALQALGLTTLGMTPTELMALDQPGAAVNELQQATLLRMVFSRRVLYEVLVEFWSDHFSMTQRDGQVRTLKNHDDREVNRKHALGKFKDILTASAKSPAMLFYLDNVVNYANNINENYAREIMELHTLGVAVDGVPYSEEDIKEVARCFTGWTISRGGANNPGRGEYLFEARRHDKGVKRVLGQAIPGNRGEEDGLQVIDILCDHPSTPRFLATKLVRRFVTDDPAREAPELVDAVAQAYARSGGDHRAMMRTLLTHPTFAVSFGRFGGKLTRPLDFAVRLLRVLGARPGTAAEWRNLQSAVGGNRGFLAQAGHIPFYWPTPDGYPDVKDAWAATGGILSRWNLGLRLAGAGEGGRSPVNPVAQMPADVATAGAAADWWIDRLLHRPMLPADRATLVDFLTAGGSDGDRLSAQMRNRLPELIALVVDSPYFLWK